MNGRLDLDGYGPWTVKAGVQHVRPPADTLAHARRSHTHLDDCEEQNGALRVLPGTHRQGRLRAEHMELAQVETAPVICSVGCGGAVLMKPLLLHASSAAQEPSHRRVIHIDYAAAKLPSGLSWLTKAR